MKRILALSALAGAMVLGSQAQACAINDWPNVNGGAVPGGPQDATNSFARFSGLCGLSASAAGDSVATATGLAADAGTRVRFYIFNDEATTATIFQGEDDGDAVLFDISMTPTEVSFDAGGAAPLTASLVAGWNSIEVEYNTAAQLIVNEDSADAAIAQTVTGDGVLGTIDQMEMGLISGTGSVIFDAAEGRRTSSTAIGVVLRGDSNGDDSLGLADAVLALREAQGLDVNPATPAVDINSGQPDYNRDGNLTLADAVLILRVSSGLPVPD